ncbi:hypothetical protein BX666DRAFT_291050 [Dichotomocladium elegans]|nr:hypothetical protein BX666DRAFT_291050 [Dichotomocladium elegans]
MSIDFLCGRQDEQQPVPTSPLHLLCDAVLEHEYINVERGQPKSLTVLVGQKCSNNAVSISMYCPGPSPVSENGNSKADSAVSMSPQQQWAPLDEGFDGILDESSDLSTIASTELAGLSDMDDIEEQSDKDDYQKEPRGEKSDQLSCIACHRELRRDEISKQVGCDTSITADLVTWTWTPSAIFTDWRPKRCPRCERHYSIFDQEWPSRKPRKRILTNPQRQAMPVIASGIKSKSKKTASPKKSKRKCSSSTPSKATAQSRKKHSPSTQLPKNNEEGIDDLFLYESPLTPLSEFYGDEDELLKL